MHERVIMLHTSGGRQWVSVPVCVASSVSTSQSATGPGWGSSGTAAGRAGRRTASVGAGPPPSAEPGPNTQNLCEKRLRGGGRRRRRHTPYLLDAHSIRLHKEVCKLTVLLRHVAWATVTVEHIRGDSVTRHNNSNSCCQPVSQSCEWTFSHNTKSNTAKIKLIKQNEMLWRDARGIKRLQSKKVR